MKVGDTVKPDGVAKSCVYTRNRHLVERYFLFYNRCHVDSHFELSTFVRFGVVTLQVAVSLGIVCSRTVVVQVM